MFTLVVLKFHMEHDFNFYEAESVFSEVSKPHFLVNNIFRCQINSASKHDKNQEKSHSGNIQKG